MGRVFEQADRDRRPAGRARAAAAASAADAGTNGFDLAEAAGIDLGEIIARYLAAEGVDLAGSVRNLQHAQAANARATANRAEALKGTARALRRARRALELEAAGWRAGWTGHTLDEVTWRQAEVAELTEQLAEGCSHDPALVREVMRSVAG